MFKNRPKYKRVYYFTSSWKLTAYREKSSIEPEVVECFFLSNDSIIFIVNYKRKWKLTLGW